MKKLKHIHLPGSAPSHDIPLKLKKKYFRFFTDEEMEHIDSGKSVIKSGGGGGQLGPSLVFEHSSANAAEDVENDYYGDGRDNDVYDDDLGLVGDVKDEKILNDDDNEDDIEIIKESRQTVILIRVGPTNDLPNKKCRIFSSN